MGEVLEAVEEEKEENKCDGDVDYLEDEEGGDLHGGWWGFYLDIWLCL